MPGGGDSGHHVRGVHDGFSDALCTDGGRADSVHGADSHRGGLHWLRGRGVSDSD